MQDAIVVIVCATAIVLQSYLAQRLRVQAEASVGTKHACSVAECCICSRYHGKEQTACSNYETRVF
jgi:hypothetical protein